MTNARRMIFYRTGPIDSDARSGSGLRPAKLLDAFRGLGYEVDVVGGHAGIRKRAIELVRRRLEAGVDYDFLYAEPPTTPMLLSEPNHVPLHPLLDLQFLRLVRSHRIPVVLFYRDVQWRLPRYASRIGWPKFLAMLPFFHLDLLIYRACVDALLVPSAAMARRIPEWARGGRIFEAPPGFDGAERPPHRLRAAGVPRLLYVGGVEPPVYDLVPLLRASAWAAEHGVSHRLTICSREPEWHRRPASYNEYLLPHVMVVHNRTRAELLELYASSDIAVMPYGTLNSDWAVPIKFPEAIGMGRPVIAGDGTAVGKIVEAERIGWVVGGDVSALRDVLVSAAGGELAAATARVEEVRPRYTWRSRAEQIARIAADVRGIAPHAVTVGPVETSIAATNPAGALTAERDSAQTA